MSSAEILPSMSSVKIKMLKIGTTEQFQANDIQTW